MACETACGLVLGSDDLYCEPRGPSRRVSACEISKSTGFHVDFGFQIGFLDFTWISGFHVDFWISKWISGFHADFRISKWISTFWILSEELLFFILKILLINKPSQPGCTQNTMSQALHSSPRRTAYCVHNILAHSLPRPRPVFGRGLGTRLRICIILCIILYMHGICIRHLKNDLCPRPKIGRVQRSFDLCQRHT